jgi:glycosyl-4,4'-diaponeurosporenoate acyltransferase
MAAQLTPAALTTVNVLAWLVIHLTVACAGTRLPVRWFRPSGSLARIRGWERRGEVYERWLAVRRWKDRLPDAAPWFGGGFAKRRLAGRDAAYLERFARETWRGECVHWVVIALAPAFFLWNPPWAGWVMVAYALAANLPCIAVQRFNRARLADPSGRIRSSRSRTADRPSSPAIRA